jgi:hypothetical protein
MQLFMNLFIFTDALHVSGNSSAHYQEYITVHTASGMEEMALLSISNTVAASGSIG